MRTTRIVVAAVVLAAAGGGVLPRTAPARGATEAGDTATADPVVVVTGTGAAPVPGVPNTLAERLTADGHRVFVYWLPNLGLGDVEDTSAPLAPFVDDVLAETGAERVDLVGHSQGGVVGRYYIKYLGGAGKVDTLVSLGAPHYGSRLANIAALWGLWDCLGFSACRQATVGSPFLAELNGDDDTYGPVAYVNIASKLDVIVVPYTNAFQRSPDATNVAVQDRCPLRVVGHIGLVLDGAVYSGIADALAHRPVTLDCGAV